MKKGKSIGIAIAILVLFGVAFYSYMGGFQQVSVIRESFWSHRDLLCNS